MSATQNNLEERNKILVELEDIFLRRCKVNDIKKGTDAWGKAQLEYMIAASTGARLAGNEDMGTALLIRATFFAAFNRDAFHKFSDDSSPQFASDEAAAAGPADGASHSG